MAVVVEVVVVVVVVVVIVSGNIREAPLPAPLVAAEMFQYLDLMNGS